MNSKKIIFMFTLYFNIAFLLYRLSPDKMIREYFDISNLNDNSNSYENCIILKDALIRNSEEILEEYGKYNVVYEYTGDYQMLNISDEDLTLVASTILNEEINSDVITKLYSLSIVSYTKLFEVTNNYSYYDESINTIFIDSNISDYNTELISSIKSNIIDSLNKENIRKLN